MIEGVGCTCIRPLTSTSPSLPAEAADTINIGLLRNAGRLWKTIFGGEIRMVTQSAIGPVVHSYGVKYADGQTFMATVDAVRNTKSGQPNATE